MKNGIKRKAENFINWAIPKVNPAKIIYLMSFIIFPQVKSCQPYLELARLLNYEPSAALERDNSAYVSFAPAMVQISVMVSPMSSRSKSPWSNI